MVHVGQLIQNLDWIFPNVSTGDTKPSLDTSKWWINGPSKTIWMNLNVSTACYQHCSNGITMCVQNQWAFLKVETLNGFKWSVRRRVNTYHINCHYFYGIAGNLAHKNLISKQRKIELKCILADILSGSKVVRRVMTCSFKSSVTAFRWCICT